MSLKDGYQIKEMTSAEFFPLFGKIYESLFGEDHTFFPDSYYSDAEKMKLKILKNRLGDPYKIFLGVFSPSNEFIGFSFGFQETEETFYMMASAILPEHRGFGLYNELLKIVIQKCTNEGFQKISGSHCATNNPVLIAKLKAGFVFSKIELSDLFGTIIHLVYFTNPLRRKVMNYRSGLNLPDAELKSKMKF
jgi:hypothetical protein